jgi:Arc/MetJ-type ribon-helix-helix transcriptional regulator
MEPQEKDERKKEASMNFRLPTTLKILVEKVVAKDTHINESDFIRDAIREKIQREAPGLLQGLFTEEG